MTFKDVLQNVVAKDCRDFLKRVLENFDEVYEKNNTIEILENKLGIKFPVIATQVSPDNEYERTVDIYFTKDEDYSDCVFSIARFVKYDEEEICRAQLEYFIKNLPIDKKYFDYSKNPDCWKLDIGFEIGNIRLFKREIENPDLEHKEYNKLIIAILPYKVIVNSRTDFIFKK